jgi:hypothetical protein
MFPMSFHDLPLHLMKHINTDPAAFRWEQDTYGRVCILGSRRFRLGDRIIRVMIMSGYRIINVDVSNKFRPAHQGVMRSCLLKSPI